MMIAFILFVLLVVALLVGMYIYIRKFEIENAKQERLQEEIRAIKEKNIRDQKLQQELEELEKENDS